MQILNTYRQLQPEERMTVVGTRLKGSGMWTQARMHRRSPVTISREFARNTSAARDYAIVPAHALNHARNILTRAAPQFHTDHVLWGYPGHPLDLKLSPQKMATILNPL